MKITINQKSIPHKYRNKHLRDRGVSASTVITTSSGSGSTTVSTVISGDYLPATLNEDGTYTVDASAVKFEGHVIASGEVIAHKSGSATSDDGSYVTVIDSLNSDSTTDALSAAQGKVLKGMIEDIDYSNYYTKNEINDKLGSVDVDLSYYYNKDQVYNKEEVDQKFENINTEDIDLTDYYTKEEVDQKIEDIEISGTYDVLEVEKSITAGDYVKAKYFAVDNGNLVVDQFGYDYARNQALSVNKGTFLWDKIRENEVACIMLVGKEDFKDLIYIETNLSTSSDCILRLEGIIDEQPILSYVYISDRGNSAKVIHFGYIFGNVKLYTHNSSSYGYGLRYAFELDITRESNNSSTVGNVCGFIGANLTRGGNNSYSSFPYDPYIISNLNDTEVKLYCREYITRPEDFNFIKDVPEETIGISGADISNYYKKSETYSKNEVDKLIEDIEVSGGDTDLSNYYTKEEVDQKIENIEISGGDIDLSNYYTKDETNDIIANIPDTDLSNYYTKPEVDNLIPKFNGNPITQSTTFFAEANRYYKIARIAYGGFVTITINSYLRANTFSILYDVDDPDSRSSVKFEQLSGIGEIGYEDLYYNNYLDTNTANYFCDIYLYVGDGTELAAVEPIVTVTGIRYTLFESPTSIHTSSIPNSGLSLKKFETEKNGLVVSSIKSSSINSKDIISSDITSNNYYVKMVNGKSYDLVDYVIELEERIIALESKLQES